MTETAASAFDASVINRIVRERKTRPPSAPSVSSDNTTDSSMESNSADTKDAPNKRELNDNDEHLAHLLRTMRETRPLRGYALWAQQMRAMVLKKLIYAGRNWKVTLAQTIVPAFFVLFAVVVNKYLMPTAQRMSPLYMTLRDSQWSGQHILLRAPTVKQYSDYYNETVIDYGANLYATAYKSLFVNDDAVQKVTDWSTRGNDDNTFEEMLFGNGSGVYDRFGRFYVDEHYLVGGDYTFAEEAYESGIVPAPHAVAQSGRIMVRFNDEPFHMPGVSMTYALNAKMRYYILRQNRDVNLSHVPMLLTVNHPLPPSNSDKLSDWMAEGADEYRIAVFLIFGMSFLASSSVLFVIRERQTGAKHLQFLAGVSTVSYWLSNIVVDLFFYILPSTAIMAVFWAFDIVYIIGQENYRWAISLLLLWSYALCVYPQMYCASFLFRTPVSGFVMMAIINLITGLTATIVDSILFVEADYIARKIAQWCFLAFVPNWSLATGFNFLYMNEFARDHCKPFLDKCDEVHQSSITAHSGTLPCCSNPKPYVDNPLEWVTNSQTAMGRMPPFLLMQAVFYWCLLAMIEADALRVQRVVFMSTLQRAFNTLANIGRRMKRAAPRRNVPEETSAKVSKDNSADTPEDIAHLVRATSVLSIEDNDVIEERRRVQGNVGGAWNDAVLTATNLSKSYGNHLAVDALSFIVRDDECFGLLGVNGAGKTSTFKMLVGENLVTGGDALVAGVSIKHSWRQAGMHIGYCPQFDALIGQMTGYETLCMYARIRGVNGERRVREVANAVIDAVGIRRYAHRQCRTYSGGNQRRLSLGIALVGLPRLLMLDEPTTGVDPAARRTIWRILSQLRQYGTAIVLTSHSMEECEALCSRITIMVGGRLRCIGSAQHLKSKYGRGYTLTVKVALRDTVRRAYDAICQSLPGAMLKEVHSTQMTFDVPLSDDITYSEVFRRLRQLVAPLGILDYSLSQTTLEQVFLEFSKQQFDQQSV